MEPRSRWADDGYAVRCRIGDPRRAAEEGKTYARIVIITNVARKRIDGLPAYIESANASEPAALVCLDGGCGSYDQLWMTTSLRGSIVGNLTAEVPTGRNPAAERNRSSSFAFCAFFSTGSRIRRGRILPTGSTRDPEAPARKCTPPKASAKSSTISVDGMRRWPTIPSSLLNAPGARRLHYRTSRNARPRAGRQRARPMTTLKLSIRLPPNLTRPTCRNQTLFESDARRA